MLVRESGDYSCFEGASVLWQRPMLNAGVLALRNTPGKLCRARPRVFVLPYFKQSRNWQCGIEESLSGVMKQRWKTPVDFGFRQICIWRLFMVLCLPVVLRRG